MLHTLKNRNISLQFKIDKKSINFVNIFDSTLTAITSFRSLKCKNSYLSWAVKSSNNISFTALDNGKKRKKYFRRGIPGVTLGRKLSPYMDNDVTTTCSPSWEIPDNSISRKHGGAWRTDRLFKRLQPENYFQTSELTKRLRRKRWSGNIFLGTEADSRRKWSGFSFLAPPSNPIGLCRLTAAPVGLARSLNRHTRLIPKAKIRRRGGGFT